MESLHPSDELLDLYRSGKLKKSVGESIKNHLETCSECANRAASMSSASFLDWIGGAQEDATLPAETAYRPSVPARANAPPPGLAEQRDYEIKKELGRAAWGLYTWPITRFWVASRFSKSWGRTSSSTPGVLDRFQREMRAVARLRHPNIVSAYSAFRLGESIVFAMEYIEGLDLSKLVRAKGPLPIAHACKFAHETALGL